MKKKVNKKKETRKIVFLTIAILIVISLIATICIGYYKKATYEVKNPVATLEVKDYGTIKIELYPEQAENTVKNFIALSNNGFYDGSTFHRIIEEFMIQGGKQEGNAPTLSYINANIEKDSDSDIEYNIDGEFMLNGYENNTLKLEKGVIAMARGDYSDYASYYPELLEEGYNSQGSQFFIMTTNDYIGLTGSYTGFGKVIEGFDIVEKVAAIEVKESVEYNNEKSAPVKAPKITSIRVETFGIDYGIPEIHEAFDINNYFNSMMSY